MRRFAFAPALGLSAAKGAAGQHAGQAPAAPWAGQQTRSVTSFSEEDLAELRRGDGWRRAKPAELAGLPGSAHVLELARELGLTPEQEARVRSVVEAMHRQAVAVGARLVEAEAALDAASREHRVTPDRLEASLAEREAARRALRFGHLAANLEMPALLASAQIARYEALRGYGVDGCAGGPPAGHCPTLWRHHTGCR